MGKIDSIFIGGSSCSNVGRRIILPSLIFIAGLRDKNERYIEAMTLIQRFNW